MLPTALTFLKDLKQNNNREWFSANRKTYLEIKNWLELAILDIIQETTKFDPEVKFITPKDALYRINRDTRFSNDKAPYKTNYGGILGGVGSNKGKVPGYYFELNHLGQIRAGGGWYIIDSQNLLKIRQQISKNPKPFEKIINQAEFKKTFTELWPNKLENAPRGFDKNNPNIELLKYKSFVGINQADCSGFSDEQLKKFVLESFAAVSPLVSYLRQVQFIDN